ncbi:NACHT domain-containing protein [Streptomyces sp. SL13]|uniref:NACHT domain-containing protein n=1 Tax=Streptantibioticus silvisoli TaxID=2705255 RepID=A0AA90GX62_9ACTN|nr:NACHT domain-containing protein [Streptantibioticus silvisoli]MDI5969753.1 NACHT domain-containing protein [Streptantibioticus silvisoli]
MIGDTFNGPTGSQSGDHNAQYNYFPVAESRGLVVPQAAMDQARDLAWRVDEGEGRVLAQLLGVDTARINLRYTLVGGSARAALAPEAGVAVADAAASLPDIAAFYRGTRPARLVITGAAGAGKTVLALELMLALLNGRAAGERVPVRVSLAQWDTDTPLSDHLIQHLVTAYQLSAAEAANLVSYRLILPVLDGLDEMDLPQADGTPAPEAPRARAALNALNAHQESGTPAPLVLTCRTLHYDALAAADTLIDAARIIITPVSTADAVAYLAYRGRDRVRWQPLLDHLPAHPASPLARLLSTPWRLCLTATVYSRGNPTELLDHSTSADLDHHLLPRYIRATATAAGANPHGYAPEDIHLALHHLAAHLAPTTPHTPARTDIVLHRLWPTAGRTRVRTADALLTTLLFLPPLLLVPTTGNRWSFALICAAAVLTGFTAGMNRDTKPVRINAPQLVTRRGVRRLASRLKTSLPVGLTNWLADELRGRLTKWLTKWLPVWLTNWLTNWLPYGLVGDLTFGLTAGASADPSSAATPGSTIRKDTQVALLSALVGILLGMLLGGPAGGLRCGLADGLALGLMVGLVNRASRRYTVFLICARRKVPFRLVRFLDWACTVGLMRYSGSAYQFRHRELQLWLATHPTPPL